MKEKIDGAAWRRFFFGGGEPGLKRQVNKQKAKRKRNGGNPIIFSVTLLRFTHHDSRINLRPSRETMRKSYSLKENEPTDEEETLT